MIKNERKNTKNERKTIENENDISMVFRQYKS